MRRKILYSFIIISFFIINGNTTIKDIIYYFKKIDNNSNLYKIENINNSWKISTPGMGYIRKSIIDIQNGFIYLNIEAGDGNFDNYIAMFVNKENKNIIGYSRYCTFYPTEIKFFKEKNDNLIEVENILPEINPKILFKKDYNFDEINKIIKQNYGKSVFDFLKIKMKYELPRYGTDIKVTLLKNNLDMCPEFNTARNINIKVFDTMMNNMIYNTLYLIWDENNGKFYYGKLFKQ